MATMRSYSAVRAVWPSLLTRISYQVGRPWMLEGNRFFPETGMPMRKMACMSRPLALADPVPLTLASLKAKSLMREVTCHLRPERAQGGLGGAYRPPHRDRADPHKGS